MTSPTRHGVRGVPADRTDLSRCGCASYRWWHTDFDVARLRQRGALAAGLAALGIGRGDAVSLTMANRIEFYPRPRSNPKADQLASPVA